MRGRAALLAVLAAAAVPLAAAARPAFGGERRPAAGFDAVEVDAPVDVDVKEGVPYVVTVTVDPGARGRVETRLEGKTLVVSAPGVISILGAARVTVELPTLRALTVNGAGSVKVAAAAKGDRDVTLDVNGSGDVAWRGEARAVTARVRGPGGVRLDGAARRLEAVVDGAGAVRARGLGARDATLRTHGAGEVEATLRGGSLRASTDGTGEIRWWGEAKVDERRVSGSGEIAHEQ